MWSTHCAPFLHGLETQIVALHRFPVQDGPLKKRFTLSIVKHITNSRTTSSQRPGFCLTRTSIYCYSWWKKVFVKCFRKAYKATFFKYNCRFSFNSSSTAIIPTLPLPFICHLHLPSETCLIITVSLTSETQVSFLHFWNNQFLAFYFIA